MTVPDPVGGSAAETPAAPEISLVIINKSDPRVAQTLEALVALDEVRSGRAEIVVVDASEGTLDNITASFRGVRWVPFTPIPHVVTIPHQRNAGINAARGEVIVFIDAACVPREGWLERLTAPILSGQERLAAGAARAPEASLRDEAVDRVADLPYLPEAPTISLALHRSVVDTIGPFDQRFAYGSDVDFTWRAVDAGFRIANVPDAVVVHDWGSSDEELDRSWRYGRARTRLYLKHTRRWKDLFGTDLPLIAYPAYLLALPFTIKRPWIHLSLAIPIWRNWGRRPILTLADHFIRGVAAFVEVGSHLSGAQRSD